MAKIPDEHKESAKLDRAHGRRATKGQLRRLLSSAPPAFLAGALENSNVGEPEIMLILRNRNAPAKLLGTIAERPAWIAQYKIKKGLAQHPHSPRALSSKLLGHLFWKDLADISDDPRLHPVLRRRAVELLASRVEELALGEAVSLARRSGPSIIKRLLSSRDAQVQRSLLGNPRLVERDAVILASREDADSGVLAYLSQHPSWGERQAVRLALITNPATPIPVALNLVGELPAESLQRLLDTDGLPKIVHIAAEREQERRSEMESTVEPDKNEPRTT